jgi:deoxyhypusine synthase
VRIIIMKSRARALGGRKVKHASFWEVDIIVTTSRELREDAMKINGPLRLRGEKSLTDAILRDASQHITRHSDPL